jgi:hypothetical protein
MIPRPIIAALLIAAILLPVTICVVFGVAALLHAMGDSSGGMVLSRVALGLGIAWSVDLIALVLTLAANALQGPHELEEPQEEEI